MNNFKFCYFSIQVFHGNVDNNTPYANSFTPPIKAQYVRLYPQVCRRHCTLRMELLGCELSGESHIIYFCILFKGKQSTVVCSVLLACSFSIFIDIHFCYKMSRAWFSEKEQEGEGKRETSSKTHYRMGLMQKGQCVSFSGQRKYNKFLLQTLVKFKCVFLILIATMIYVL